ncbi:MAG TPA: type II toxin-antitoxin system VapC family toxin [Aestuariivirga sp.]|nr:type II toxin-antitoxin system VapC family toxin [Aestuariivirga sp.]
MSTVIDSSALLALLWSEPGHQTVLAAIDGAAISAVNMAEVASKLADRGITGVAVSSTLARFPIEVVPFDERQAMRTGALRDATRRLGLSIGDRACLGLALAEGAKILTADRHWARLDLGIDITLIR